LDKIKQIEDCRIVGSIKNPKREYLIQWENNPTKSWISEIDISPCSIVDYFDQNLSQRQKCNIKSPDTYNDKIKKEKKEKITANDIFINATQNAINEFVDSDLEIQILLLDGVTLNTTFRLLNEIVPEGIIQNIVVPNPNSSYLMRQLFCKDDRLVEKLELYNNNMGTYLKSLEKGTKDFTSIWLDYTGSWFGNAADKFSPKKDIEEVFKKEIIRDGGILAITLYLSRGLDYQLPIALDEIPKIANKYGYSLTSMCGNNLYYVCEKDKLKSVYSYGKGFASSEMALLVYKVHDER
jgi:hypothetical protein